MGETLEQAVIREIREEVDILIKPVGLIEALDRIVHDEKGVVLYHYVLLDFLCLYLSGKLRAHTDAIKARWVRDAEIGRYALPRETEEVIRKALQMAGSWRNNH